LNLRVLFGGPSGEEETLEVVLDRLLPENLFEVLVKMFVLNDFALHALQVNSVLAERPAFFYIEILLQFGLQLAPDVLVH